MNVKTGGRKKGTPNKRNGELHDRAYALGVDPFQILLLFCKRDWKALGYDSGTVTRMTPKGETFDEERITAKMQLDAACEACQYLESKRKAVEISTDPENPLDMRLEITEETLTDLVKIARG